MPRYIVKPDPHQDFYVEWSTVVDAPLNWGTREEFETYYRAMKKEDHVSEDRFKRANASGSSSVDGFFGWKDQDFLYQGDDGFYDVARKDIIALCTALEEHDSTEPEVKKYLTPSKWLE